MCKDLQAVGYEVLLVQENKLYDIVDISNRWGADLFVSIHCNSATNIEAKGTETFAYTSESDSDKLAQCIQSQIINSLSIVDRGVKYSGFYTLKYTDAPAMLVEIAFISNVDDEKLLAEKKAEFSHAIARGITDYYL